MKKSAYTLAILAALALAACGNQAQEKKDPAPATTSEVPAVVTSDAVAPAASDAAIPAASANLEKFVEAQNAALANSNNEMMKVVVSLDKSANVPTIVYETTMLKIAADSPEAKAMTGVDMKAAEEMALKTTCATAPKEIVDAGVAYKTVTKDKDGKELSTFTLDLTKCKK